MFWLFAAAFTAFAVLLGAGLIADGLNYFLGDDDEDADKLRATKGVFGGMWRAAAVNAALATGIGGLTAAPEVTSAAARFAAPHISRFVNGASTAATGTLIRHQDKVNKAAEVASGIIDPGPPSTPAAYAGAGGKWAYDKAAEYAKRKKTIGR